MKKLKNSSTHLNKKQLKTKLNQLIDCSVKSMQEIQETLDFYFVLYYNISRYKRGVCNEFDFDKHSRK